MSIPGYVDLQVNGYIGVDYSSEELTADDFVLSAEKLIESGTYMFLPTIITSPMERYQRNIELILTVVEKEGLQEHIPGIHLEGPFLCPQPGAIGAHNPEWAKEPNIKDAETLVNYCGDKLKIMTVAAGEPNIEPLIQYLVENFIRVSLGHQLAADIGLQDAQAAGARALTHLGNGIPNILPRHDNPLWNSLAKDKLIPMLITDGHHLPANFIKCVLKMKGAENIIVVSDMSPPAGLPPGKYHVLGNNAVLEANGKLHSPEKQCLVGSASNMTMCMDYLESLNLLSNEELELVGYHNPKNFIMNGTKS